MLGAARSFALAGDFDAALTAYARALELGLEEALQPLAQAPLSLAHKRRGAWPRAVDLWEVMRRRQGRGAVWALVELAKYHEHRAGEFHTARDCTLEALEQADRLLDALPQPLARPCVGAPAGAARTPAGSGQGARRRGLNRLPLERPRT